MEVAVPQDVLRSADTFELQVAQQHYTVALPKTPGTYTLPVIHALFTGSLWSSDAAGRSIDGSRSMVLVL